MKTRKSFLISFALSMIICSSMAYGGDVRVFVRHTVTDFPAWKKGYDAFAPEQKKAGVFNKSVYQSVDNPNDLTVIHDFHSLDKAKDFVDSQSLAEDMQKNGVQGKPDIWITTTTEKKQSVNAKALLA